MGLQQEYIKLSFRNVQDLQQVKSKIRPVIAKNKAREVRVGGLKPSWLGDDGIRVSRRTTSGMPTPVPSLTLKSKIAQYGRLPPVAHLTSPPPLSRREESKTRAAPKSHKQVDDVMDNVLEMREYDVSYHMRASIDCKINVGKWFAVRAENHQVQVLPTCPCVACRCLTSVLFIDRGADRSACDAGREGPSMGH